MLTHRFRILNSRIQGHVMFDFTVATVLACGKLSCINPRSISRLPYRYIASQSATTDATCEIIVDGRFKSKIKLQHPYVCKVEGCGRGFSTQHGLDKHTPQHDLTRKHVCHECHLRFKKQYNLISYTRTHTGEKPHKCDHPGCDYSATTFCHLTNY